MFTFAGGVPTGEPTGQPTRLPSGQPTGQPTQPTSVPTVTPFGNAPPYVKMGAVATYAAFGGSEVTNSGYSVLTGDLGVYPGSLVTVSQNKTCVSIHACYSVLIHYSAFLFCNIFARIGISRRSCHWFSAHYRRSRIHCFRGPRHGHPRCTEPRSRYYSVW